MEPMQEMESLALAIADAARTSFRTLLKMVNVTITVRYILPARDMRQASPPGHGRLWSGKQPDKEKKAARRKQQLRSSSNGPTPIHPIVATGMRTLSASNNCLWSALPSGSLKRTKVTASLI